MEIQFKEAMNIFQKELLDSAAALDYLEYKSLVFIVLAIVLMFLGKLIYDMLTPFSVNKELTGNDNKALAISFAGYIFSIGIIIFSVLASPGKKFITDIIETSLWSLGGILLLNISRVINDKIILSKFNNTKEIIEDKNPGTGCVEAGSYIGTALIIRAVLSGEQSVIGVDILATLIFYVLGQIAFILFGLIYQKITSYDIHKEIEADNAAAGLAFGMTLIAIGIILSNAIIQSNSLAVFGIWFVNGVVLLIISRIMVDKLILPASRLDDEISRDRNWGAALIEGAAAFAVAFILSASFV